MSCSCYVCLNNKPDCKHIYSVNNQEISMAYFISDKEQKLMFKDLNCDCLKDLLISNYESICCNQKCTNLGQFYCSTCHYKFCHDCTEFNGVQHYKLDKYYYIKDDFRNENEKHILYPKNYRINKKKFNSLLRYPIMINSKIEFLINNKVLKYDDKIKYSNIISKSSTKLFDEIINKKKINSSKLHTLSVLCNREEEMIDKHFEKDYEFVLKSSLKLTKYFADMGVKLDKRVFNEIIQNNFFFLPDKRLMVFVLNKFDNEEKKIKVISINLNYEKKRKSSSQEKIKPKSVSLINTISTLVSTTSIPITHNNQISFYMKCPYHYFNFDNPKDSEHFLNKKNDENNKEIKNNVSYYFSDRIFGLHVTKENITEDIIFSVDFNQDQDYSSRFCSKNFISIKQKLKEVLKVLEIKNSLILLLKEDDFYEIQYYTLSLNTKTKKEKYFYQINKAIKYMNEVRLIGIFSTFAITENLCKKDLKKNKNNNINNGKNVSILISFIDHYEVIKLPEYHLEAKVDTIDFISHFFKSSKFDLKNSEFNLNLEVELFIETFYLGDHNQIYKNQLELDRDNNQVMGNILNDKNLFIREGIKDIIFIDEDNLFLVLNNEGKVVVYTDCLTMIIKLLIDLKICFFKEISYSFSDEEEFTKYENYLIFICEDYKINLIPLSFLKKLRNVDNEFGSGIKNDLNNLTYKGGDTCKRTKISIVNSIHTNNLNLITKINK